MAGRPEMAKKPLNVGMIGYGFMGRTHSNAFSQVNHFFDVPYRTGAESHLCPRWSKGQGLRRTTGAMNRLKPTGANWLNARTLMSSISPVPITPIMKLQSPPRRPARWSCAKNLWPIGKRMRDGGGRREGGGAKHGLVQLPARAGRHPCQAVDRRRPARPHFSLPRQVPAGLDDFQGPPPGWARPLASGRRTWPEAASPATCWPTASTQPSGSTAALPKSRP